jgi:hypothetical protein
MKVINIASLKLLTNKNSKNNIDNQTMGKDFFSFKRIVPIYDR